ncbi:hypothetical protein F5Y03DRAFT_224916 [Xylaria venustula]|nr:hypothetical protein F5Y03DRAFT_224916 [Xylaria venustula]
MCAFSPLRIMCVCTQVVASGAVTQSGISQAQETCQSPSKDTHNCGFAQSIYSQYSSSSNLTPFRMSEHSELWRSNAAPHCPNFSVCMRATLPTTTSTARPSQQLSQGFDRADSSIIAILDLQNSFIVDRIHFRYPSSRSGEGKRRRLRL